MISDELKSKIPVLKPGEDYIKSVFESTHLEGFPSFMEYLREYRKVDLDTIPEVAWFVLTLQTEVMMYNLVMKNFDQEQKKELLKQLTSEQLAQASLNDLMMQRAMLAADLDRLDHELAKASQEKVQEDQASKG